MYPGLGSWEDRANPWPLHLHRRCAGKQKCEYPTRVFPRAKHKVLLWYHWSERLPGKSGFAISVDLVGRVYVECMVWKKVWGRSRRCGRMKGVCNLFKWCRLIQITKEFVTWRSQKRVTAVQGRYNTGPKLSTSLQYEILAIWCSYLQGGVIVLSLES